MRSLVARTVVVAAISISAAAAFAQEAIGPATTRETPLGTILVGPNGMTLYTYDRDRPGVSNCQRDCAFDWPPFLVLDDTTPADGRWSTVTHFSGFAAMVRERPMWAFDGKPLYYSALDVEPGDVNADGLGGVWHAVVIEPPD